MLKQTLLSIAAACSIAAASAQDYKAPLAQHFTAFDTTSPANIEAKTAAANKLTLIAKKWPNEGITNYYAALSKAQLSYMLTDAAQRDALVDESEEFLKMAVSAWGKETDETHVLRAQIASARMAVDGQKRWQKYGKIFNDELDAAKEINANNPRIFLLRGQSKFWTPKMFGGGKKASKPYFEKAIALFATQPANDWTAPSWGLGSANYHMRQIDGADED
jgi:hypothetical protein